MKKSNLALIFFFLLFMGQNTIYTRDSQGYLFQLLEFSTNKTHYLVNETVFIYAKWNHFLEESEVGFLRFEVFDNKGILLNQSQSFDENRLNFETIYALSIIELNLKPQTDPLDVSIMLHFYVKNLISGEFYEIYDSRGVQISFLNLSYSLNFSNSTNLCHSDLCQISLSFFERDLEQFQVNNLSLSSWIEDEENIQFYKTNYSTNSFGQVKIPLYTDVLLPGRYEFIVFANNSKIFNTLEIQQTFVLFPGNLTLLQILDSYDLPVSVPEQGLLSKKSLYLHLWYQNESYSPTDLSLNWTLSTCNGTLEPLQNGTYFCEFGPITNVGENKLVINGSSKYFYDFNLQTTIIGRKRDVISSISYFSGNQTLFLELFDRETGILLDPRVLGDIVAFEESQEIGTKKLPYSVLKGGILFSPLYLSKENGYQIIITIQENEAFSSYTEQLSAPEIFGSVSGASSDYFIAILIVCFLPGPFIAYLLKQRTRQRKQIFLRKIQFEI